MTSPPDDPPRRRADQLRNRHRILAVAREMFARTPASEIQLEDVARAAGVGRALAGWIRIPTGNLQSHIADGAPVQVIYRNPRRDAFLRIAGVARLADDDATRDRVFGDAAPQEQAADPGRRGVAMVIDVERVAGYVGSDTVCVEMT